MIEYNFTTVNQRKALFLFFILFALFFSLIFVMNSFKYFFNIYVTLILAFGIPILLFVKFKNKILENCTATLSLINTEVKKDNKIQIINFKEIENYKFENYDKLLNVSIKLKDKQRCDLNANANFGETQNFEQYCLDLQTAIENYETINNIAISRAQTLFEKKWIFPALLLITLLIIIFYIILHAENKSNEISFIPILAPLLILWSSYFNKNKKNRAK